MASTVASMMPRERPAPAGMRRADDPRLAVAQQNRRAIGGENADGQPGLRRHDGVGLGHLAVLPWSVGHHRIGAVLLEDGEQASRLRAQELGHARPVLGHIGARRRASPGPQLSEA